MLIEHGRYFVEPETGRVFGQPLGSPDTSGYLRVDARPYGAPSNAVSRVVWEAVKGPIPEGMQINHRNGTKTDNRISNLECVTPAENTRHAFETGLRQGLAGEDHPGAKLTVKAVKAIRRASQRGSTPQELAARFGVSRRCVADVINGDTWAEVI